MKCFHYKDDKRFENCEDCPNIKECNVGKLINDTKDKKRFDFLNSRVHTREASTLAIMAILVSASLLIYVYAIEQRNPLIISAVSSLISLTFSIDPQPLFFFLFFYTFNNPDFWSFAIGLLLIISAILYREATIRKSDATDYELLSSHIRKSKSTQADSNKPSTETEGNQNKEYLRGAIVRLVLFGILTIWFNHYFGMIGLIFGVLIMAISVSILTIYEPPRYIHNRDLRHDPNH